MGDTPEKKGRAKKSKADRLSEILRIMANSGLTIKDIEAAFTGEPMPVGSGDCSGCDPCFEESAGILTCTGTGKHVIPFPDTTVHVVPYFTSAGHAGWANLAALMNTVPPNPNGPAGVEAAPPPRENGGPGEQTDM